jgi:hypothetical protein
MWGMKRGLRFLFARIALGGLTIGGSLTPAACGLILGIDDGRAKVDASDGSDDSTIASDGMADVEFDASQGDDQSDGGGVVDAGDAMDASVDVDEGGDAADTSAQDGGDGCVPDPDWCTSHCGTGPDNCDLSRGCANYCQSGWLCDPSTHSCMCQTDPMWCSGRCGKITDNCGKQIDCRTCSSGVACTSNTCGCTPLPDPCGTMQCGQTMDSCGHPVSCGINGRCAGGGVCDPGGTCCTPKSNPCAGRCGTAVDNGCGQMIACPATCGSGQVCDPQGYCCSPTSCGNACGVVLGSGCGGMLTCSCTIGVCYQGQCCVSQGLCSGNCVNDCGQPSQTCCRDSGPPPIDGGMCGPLGAACAGGQDCCSGFCNAAMSCVQSCHPSHTSCRLTSECCYGLTCAFSGIEGGAGMSPTPGPGPPLQGQCL